MGFKVFTDYGAASRDTLTLRASGYLFIPEMQRKRSKAPKAEMVRIHVDENEDPVIAVEFLDEFDEDEEGSKKLSIEKSGVAINILPVLRFLGIDKPESKENLKGKWQDGLLVVDLTKLKNSPDDQNLPH